jgi:hypothetical protein
VILIIGFLDCGFALAEARAKLGFCGGQQSRQMPLILRSTIASSWSSKDGETGVDVGTSAARGWRWPTGADQGLVVISFPAMDGRKAGAKAIALAVSLPATTASRGLSPILDPPFGW